MFIQTENTPNPATVKFLPGQTVLEQGGSADFQSAELAQTYSPLAARLFAIQGVAGVFLGRDFVSVSKAPDTDWPVLKPMILATLMEHFSTQQPIIDEAFFEKDKKDKAAKKSGSDISEEDEDIIAQIEELIDTRVRPMVAMDGGDIVFESYDDGIVYLQMRGACSGCPSSTATLKSGIENMLQHFVPEVKEVRPVAM
jgi:Fe-S cluster biogenesis protein NfuA